MQVTLDQLTREHLRDHHEVWIVRGEKESIRVDRPGRLAPFVSPEKPGKVDPTLQEPLEVMVKDSEEAVADAKAKVRELLRQP